MTERCFGSMVAEIDGSGDPIVMLHGLGGTANTFQPLMNFAETHRVIRPDLPGAGRSAYQPGRTGLASLADAVIEFLDAHSIKRATFVGHSMGTILCQIIARDHPERVASLCLFGAITEPPVAARAALNARAAAAREQGMAAIADAVAGSSLSAVSQESNPVCVAFVRESVLRQNPEGYASHCKALAGAHAVDPKEIACPVALLTGAGDPVAPPAMAQALNDSLKHASLTIVPGCGHWPTIECPKAARGALQTVL